MFDSVETIVYLFSDVSLIMGGLIITCVGIQCIQVSVGRQALAIPLCGCLPHHSVFRNQCCSTVSFCVPVPWGVVTVTK